MTTFLKPQEVNEYVANVLHETGVRLTITEVNVHLGAIFSNDNKECKFPVDKNTNFAGKLHVCVCCKNLLGTTMPHHTL